MQKLRIHPLPAAVIHNTQSPFLGTMILSLLYNRPNTIINRQKAIQSSHSHIIYRLPRSKLYVGTFGTTFVVGMVGTVWGLYTLVKGKPKEQ